MSDDLENINYSAPKALFSPHLETIIPALFRKVEDIQYERERINTPDNDFLDLDWVKTGSDKVVIISHGLEGSADRPYIKGMARTFSHNGYDALAWNFRGCSGEMNRKLRFYHSGATDDLEVVVNYATKNYKEVNLIGFSLGGNITLKYLGELPRGHIHRAVAFSVPLNLHSSCIKISELSNFIYAQRFLNNLKDKIRLKARLMPDALDTKPLKRIKKLTDFDDTYTAPIHGFAGAVDYYTKCSSLFFLDGIKTPTLLVNAKNDPFLSAECYPHEQLKNHNYIKFEVPERGGHVGFSTYNDKGRYWSEKRALDFIRTDT